MRSRRPTLRAVLLAFTLPAALALTPTAGAEDWHNHAYGDAAISMDRVVVPMVFPVIGAVSYSDTFLACRSGCARKHFGQDLMGRKMQPLVAAFTGQVSSLKRESAPGEGNYLTVTSPTGWSAVYIHINNDTPGTDDGRGTASYAFMPGIREGAPVFAGQQIAWLGDSGNAEGTGPHLHFELRRGGAWSGTVYNAIYSLDAARRIAAPTLSGPHPDGLLIRGDARPETYLLRGGKKHLVNPSVFTINDYNPAAVLKVSQAEADWYEKGLPAQVRDGRVIKDAAGTLWVVVRGYRQKLPGPEALTRIGARAERVRLADAAALAATPIRESVVLPVMFRNGNQVRIPGSTKTYLVWDRQLRYIDPWAAATWRISSADTVDLPAQVPPIPGLTDKVLPASELPMGPPLRLADGSFARTPTGVYFAVVNGVRRGIGNSYVLHNFGWSRLPVTLPDATAIARLPTGPNLP